MAQSQMSEEQARELQERIKNMSPEELRDFQKKQCIFCQIVAGKIQAKKIYEDDKVLGILDINPANPGHVLLLPKEHYSIMPQVPEDEIGQIFIAAKHLSNYMLRSIEAQGTNIIVANGVAAGQRAQHFMLHLIPRKENDGINFVLPQKTLPAEIIEQVGDKLSASLGGKPEPEIKHEPKHEPLHHAHPASQKHMEQQHKKHEAQETQSVSGHQKSEGFFSEVKEESEQEESAKEPQANREEKHKPQNEHPQKKEAKSGIDLDDIAKLLGAK